MRHARSSSRGPGHSGRSRSQTTDRRAPVPPRRDHDPIFAHRHVEVLTVAETWSWSPRASSRPPRPGPASSYGLSVDEARRVAHESLTTAQRLSEAGVDAEPDRLEGEPSG